MPLSGFAYMPKRLIFLKIYHTPCGLAKKQPASRVAADMTEMTEAGRSIRR